MVNNNTKRKLLINTGVLLFSAVLVALAVYIDNIRLRGDFSLTGNIEKVKVTAISPLNRQIHIIPQNNVISGYYRNIIIEPMGSNIPEVTCSYRGCNEISIRLTNKGNDVYEIVPFQLSFWEKTKAFLFYSRHKLVIVFVFSLLILGLIYSRNVVVKRIKSYFLLTKSRLGFIKIIVRKSYGKILIASVVSGMVYPVLFLAGIDFSVIYNVPHWEAYLLTLPFFIIPVCGVALWQYLKRPFVFACFWLVLYCMYFIISPHVFAGNFGFHGFFHGFIIEAMNNGLWNSITVPDTGYLAILPRIIYAFSAWVNPSMSQVMALTSFISLVLYAYFFAKLLSKELSFLWVSQVHGFLFVVITSLFPVFGLVPGLMFPLPATDIAYYGIVFITAAIFIVASTPSNYRPGLILISLIIVMSKAHMVVLLPVLALVLIYAMLKRHKSLMLYSAIVMTGLVIQGIFCYVSLKGPEFNDMNTPGSFAIGSQSIEIQILLGLIYYIKSYLFLLFPVVRLGGKLAYIWFFTIIPCVLIMYCYAIKNIIKNRDILLSVWFLLCNITAFSSSLFYAYTSGELVFVPRQCLDVIIAGVEINIMRYTVGVHTMLAISVIPFLLYYIDKFLSGCTRYASFLTGVLLLLVLYSGFLFHKTTSTFPEFWAISKNDNWSREWSKITPLLKEKDYYIPIVFYPEYKQNMHSDGVFVIADFLPDKESFVKLKDSSYVKSVLILADNTDNEANTPAKAALFSSGVEKKQLRSYYTHEKNFRFVIFIIEDPVFTDSIVFYNERNSPASIRTHIRVIGVK